MHPLVGFNFEFFKINLRNKPGESPRRCATDVSNCRAVMPGRGAIVVDPPSLFILKINLNILIN